jgi:hypothetical protein
VAIFASSWLAGLLAFQLQLGLMGGGKQGAVMGRQRFSGEIAFACSEMFEARLQRRAPEQFWTHSLGSEG